MIQVTRKYAALKGVVETCDRTVRERLERHTLREATIALESFNNGGKRLRPALLVLSSMVPDGRGVGDAEPALYDLAGAVELVHLATLFHDDVIDKVDTRRTKQSARLKYGNYVSVLTGDFALAEALDLVHRSGVSEAMPEFIRAIRVLVRGESMETSHKYNYDLNEAQYFDIISEKSASLFALSCKIGGLARGPQYADTLGHFGWNLGMAFQMIDDLDDMLDHPNHSYDCDLRNGYLALPMIRVLNTLTDGHRSRLVDMIDRADFSPENEKFIAGLCVELGTIRQCRDAVRGHLDRAHASLEKFDSGAARDLLAEILSDLAGYTDRQADNFEAFAAAAN